MTSSPEAPELLYGPHRERVRAILDEHAEIRDLRGPNVYTFAVISGLVALQVGLAIFLSTQPWWLMLLVAYAVGAFANHALFVMIHECSHRLVFRNRQLNLWAEIFANLPLVMPMAVSFERYHLKHHAHLGEYPNDPDIPYPLEAWLTGRSAWRKALWILMYPIWLGVRTFRVTGVKVFDFWIVANFTAQLAFDLALLYWVGIAPVIYLAASTYFCISLHPLGARWIQEHFQVRAPQETYSYYGVLNWPAFNMGYHNEHHDFPRIPWNRLPSVRRIGGAWYDRLAFHRSWSKLLWKFIFDPQFHLHERMASDAPWESATPGIKAEGSLAEAQRR